jgi:hypothetical protein
MNPGPTVFAQILAGLNRMELARAAAKFPMPRASRSLTVHDHFAAMIFAQLTYRESLRGIEACLITETTAIYTEVTISQLIEVHTRCHPAERPDTALAVPASAP